MQDYTLHTHTIGFDGHASIDQMVYAAKNAGIKTIGFSNHFIVHPDIERARMYKYAVRGGYQNIYSASFGDVIAKFRAHYDQLTEMSYRTDMRILRGMEVDYFPTTQWRDGFLSACEILRPDYLIGSAHFIDFDGYLCNMHDLAIARPDMQRDMLRMYWDGVGRAAQSGLFTWMAHLNLPHKVGCGWEDMWTPLEQAAVNAISATDTAIELNTGARDGIYPSDRILKMAAAAKVPVLISDDAHNYWEICEKFDVAAAKIQEYKLRHLTLAEILSRGARTR